MSQSEQGQIGSRKALLYTIIGRVFQIIAGLGTIKVMTAYLSKEQVGEYGLFVNIATLLTFVAFRPLNQYFCRRLYEWFESGNLTAVLKRYFGIQFFVGLVSIPIIAVAAGLISIHTTVPILSWAVVWSLWCFFSGIFNTSVPALNLLGYRLQWVINNSLGLSLCLAAAWITALVHPSAFYWTAALTFGFMLSAITSTFVLVRIARQRPRQPELLGKVVSLDFLIPATVAVGGIWIQFQAFRLFVLDFMSLGQYGLFTAGYNLAAGVMAAIEGLTAQYLQPFFYSALLPHVSDADKSKQWSIFAGIMITLTGATSLIAIAYGPMICNFLLSKEFKNAWPYFFVGIVIEGIRVVSGATSLGTHVTLEVQRSLRSYIAGIIALAVGMVLGRLFHSLAVFAVVIVTGCVAHIVVLSLDVSKHLMVTIAVPSKRYFVALGLTVSAFVISTMMGASFGLQLPLIGIASLLYIALMLDINAHFSLVN